VWKPRQVYGRSHAGLRVLRHPLEDRLEPVTGDIKKSHSMERNHLAGPQGDAINAQPAATACKLGLSLD
jgi:hypothetical protein